MSNRFTKASLLTGTFMAGAMIASPAFAQTADDELGTEAAAESSDGGLIIVTGSRIGRRNVDTAAPIAVVGGEEFELSGTVNVENVINQLPQVIPGTTSFSNNPGGGVATLNLRGLGSNRTLVLVNGRRWLSYDTSQIVDLNTIPSFLLDSVDVVTGGASAVYGSDALSGVVNFRLKEVEGIELGGQYSLTEEGDAQRFNVHGAIGAQFADGRGSATVYAEYYKRDSLFQGDRAFSNFALGGETFGAPLQQFGSSTLPQGRFNFPAATASGLVFDDAVFDQPGVARARAGDTYNYAPVNYLQVPQERYLLGGYADYEFSDGHEAYTEVTFVSNRVDAALAATPVTGTFNIDIATVSPFLNQAAINELNIIDSRETGVNQNNGVVQGFVQRRVVETGLRENLDERNAFRVLGGVRGAITDWLNYDAYYSYSRTRNANIQQGNVSRSAFQAGLDGTGTAINIFGPNTLTPAMVDAISIQAQNGDVSTQQVASGVLSGFLGSLFGADDVGFAIGAEYRKVGSQFIPDTALASGDVIGFNAGEATAGSYNVKELFAELSVPILGPDSGIERLELTGAARYSDYSLDAVGGVYTYAGGIEFAPIRDIMFRAQYQRAVRAPNVGELFGGQAIGFPGATDPCSVAGAQNDAIVNQLCIGSGVPAALVGNSGIQLNAQIPALFGGNPNLQEETSESFTAGVVIQPTFIPGLTITADYFDIKIEDAVSTLSLQTSFDLCFETFQDLNNPFCQAFVGIRDTQTGSITVDNPPLNGTANIANIAVSGVDVEVNYSTTIPFSLLTDTGEQSVSLSFLGTWTESSTFQPVLTEPTFFECSGQFGGNCGEPTPSFKWSSRVSFTDGPLTTSIRWRHLSAVDDNDDTVNYADFNGVERISAYDLIDLTFSADVNENLTLSLGVSNLFDTLPGDPTFNAAGEVSNRPNSLLLGDNQEQANTFPSTYDVLGRDFFASVKLRF